MLTWISETLSWVFYDNIYPFLDVDFLTGWLLTGDVPLIVTLIVLNSLFLIYRLFDSVGSTNSDWDSSPTLVLQGGLIVGNAAIIAVDASARGWI